MNFQELEEELQKAVNGVGKDILEVILQAKDEEIKKARGRRSTWEIVRKNDARTILTPFGDITYERSYYRNKTTGEYLHLLDAYTGFKKRKRIDPLLEALILEKATECSYQKAGREILPQREDLTVSPEVVKRLVHHSPRDQRTPTSGRRKNRSRRSVPTSSSKPMKIMYPSRKGGASKRLGEEEDQENIWPNWSISMRERKPQTQKNQTQKSPLLCWPL